MCPISDPRNLVGAMQPGGTIDSRPAKGEYAGTVIVPATGRSGVSRFFKLLLTLSLIVSTFLGWTLTHRNVEPIAGAVPNTLRMGISYGNQLPALTGDAIAQALDDAVTLGTRWIRLDFSWADIQPTTSQSYVWDGIDRVITQAVRRNLSVLPVLTRTPGWARASDCFSDHCPPADPAQFANFARAAATRYGASGVHTWEIWNEENSSAFWQPKADPSAYTHLLAATSQSLRNADPHAYVLMGGLAQLQTANGNSSIADFVADPAGSPLRLVDGLAVHPYTFPYSPNRLGPWASPWNPGASGMPYLRQVLSDSGVPNLPIWITEYGAPTWGEGQASGGSGASISGGAGHVTEAEQAVIATEAVAAAASEPNVQSLFWYTDRDTGSPVDSPESYFGLRKTDGSEKPAFAAFKAAIEKLRQ